jgi:biopolymer transport protein ExbD
MAHRRKAEPGPGVELPITPMLDMAFQVFAFFVFTYHPSGLEGQMDLHLPSAAEAKAKTEADVNPSKPSDVLDVELPSELTVVVRAQRGDGGGGISQLVVQKREGEVSVANLQELAEHLEKARKEVTSKDDIKIQPDSHLKYEFVVQVMDACTRAGFQQIGFAPPLDLGSTGQ